METPYRKRLVASRLRKIMPAILPEFGYSSSYRKGERYGFGCALAILF
jgi:hypothetical protein